MSRLCLFNRSNRFAKPTRIDLARASQEETIA
jgi:hypothetical protein